MPDNNRSQVISCFGVITAIVIGFYLTSLHSYLLFHSLIEIITIAIGFTLFIITLNTSKYLTNNYLKLLGIGYAFIALIDLLHTLAYKGMSVFPGYGANLPTQLWIAARYLQAVTLLAAPLFVERRANNRVIIAGYATTVSLLVAMVYSGNFPACFIEGTGLTTFKIASEYVITALLLASLYLFYRKRNHFNDRVFSLATASIACTVLSEISFTAYASVYGFANMVGHLSKLAAFYLIYRAILVTGLKEPFDLIFRDLKQAQEALHMSYNTLEEKVRERTEELHLQTVVLEAEVAERHAAQENLENQAVVLEEEITERQLAQDEIIKLNAELEQRVQKRTAQLQETNNELEAFSYSVSHDLRAPLRSIDGFSQALLEDYPEKLDEQGKDYLNRVRAASQRMAVLIDDMLKLSRVTRSAMKSESVDLSALARSVAEEFRRTEPDRVVEFIIQDGLAAQGDPQLLRAVLENLIGNAWKFTSQQETARIEFGVSVTDGKAEYFVRDNGAGFDMLYADKLFVPFQRLHACTEFSGTGIGLSIVQRVIHRHGGEIRAEGAPGQGAAIYFTLQ